MKIGDRVQTTAAAVSAGFHFDGRHHFGTGTLTDIYSNHCFVKFDDNRGTYTMLLSELELIPVESDLTRKTLKKFNF